MSTTVLAAPLSLWNLYVEYLWNYQRDSWVDRVASTFRVLALLLITPFAILTMLVRSPILHSPEPQPTVLYPRTSRRT